MKYILKVLIIYFLLGCSNKFKIDKKELIKFEEAYYQEWVAGIKGAGAGINITLIPMKEIRDNSIKVQGIYFRNEYTKLTFYQASKFQGTIKTNKNDSTTSLEGDKIESTTKKKSIPFKLKENEAIISYVKDGKKRYFKITLTKKRLKDLPM